MERILRTRGTLILTIKFLTGVLAGTLLLLVLTGAAEAASLYFSPSSGEQQLGSTFSVTVFVSSPEQAMNAASGAISFPPDKLSVTSLSRTGSVVNFWVAEPSFSNEAGTVSFEGVVLNPGFRGSAGRLVTINFRTKAAGNPPLVFRSSSVLANDGRGTNILTEIGNATFSVGGSAAEEIISTAQAAGVPAAPRIASPTHSDAEKWYASSDPRFEWDLPTGVDTVRLGVGQNRDSLPTVEYDQPVRFRELDDLADGVWYFKAQLHNNLGWSEIGTYRFQIDTVKPSKFNLEMLERSSRRIARVQFRVEAEDQTSGVDHYEVWANEEKLESWRDDGTHRYTVTTLRPGEYQLRMRALDKAGNFLEQEERFAIEAIAPPRFADYPRQLSRALPLKVAGESDFPDATVIVWLEPEGGEAKSYETRTSRDGKFSLTIETVGEVEKPHYIYGEVVTDEWERSNLTEKLKIDRAPSGFRGLGGFGRFVINVLPWFITIVLLYLIGRHFYTRHTSLLEKVRKEIQGTDRLTKRSLTQLRDDVVEEMKRLEQVKSKKGLALAEEKILKRLRKEFERTEKIIRKEISDIEKFLD